MTTYRFEEVTHSVTKRVPCRVCGKKIARSITLSQTINPFNRNASGDPKTRNEIRDELRQEAADWMPRNDVHAACAARETAGTGA